MGSTSGKKFPNQSLRGDDDDHNHHHHNKALGAASGWILTRWAGLAGQTDDDDHHHHHHQQIKLWERPLAGSWLAELAWLGWILAGWAGWGSITSQSQ